MSAQRLFNISRSELYKLYIEDKLTSREIGCRYNVGWKTICNRLTEYNIPIRNRVEAAKGWNRHPRKGFTIENGYRLIWVEPTSPYRSMIERKSYIREHRLIMAKHLGRCLHKWEQVHHKNGNKLDNQIENLELTMLGAHIRQHNKGYRDGFNKGYYDGKDKKIKDLETRIKELEQSLGRQRL